MHNIIQMETSAKLYSLPFGNVKTYLFALLFVAGNIALPQLCHLVPAGGPTLLPIYFFTLIAAYIWFQGRSADGSLVSGHQSSAFCHACSSRVAGHTYKVRSAGRNRRSCCTLCQEYLFIGIAGCNPLLSNYRYGL